MSLKISMNRIKAHLGVLSLFLVFSLSGFSQDGEGLFKANCASCHKLDKKLVGPALAGVEDRWESRENLVSWIKNSGQYLKDNPGDEYAQNLFVEFKKSPMPAMALSDADIDAILGYIANPPVKVEETPGDVPAAAAGPSKDYSMYWLSAFSVVFLIIIMVLLSVKNALKKLLLEVKGEEAFKAAGEFDDIDLSTWQQFALWTERNKIYMIATAVAAFVGILYIIWGFIFNIGVYKGYAPEQPIKFSHQIHAGDDGIDCKYCHFGAYEGKAAGIPPVNVCMNCHRGIQEGKRWGTEEIAKIYKAAGWDAENSEYVEGAAEGIQWTKIHNLPDHVYFNHSQHVVVGKVDCKECHGDVATFDYPMHQENDLTMGWCIECHRTKKVKMNGNPYYDKLQDQLIEKYKHEGLENFTVDQAGGLECAKCHY
jgi:cytochrome c551/c552